MCNVGCNKLLVESDQMEVVKGNSLGVAAAIYEECTFLFRNFTRVILSDYTCNFIRAEPSVFVRAILVDDVIVIPDQ